MPEEHHVTRGRLLSALLGASSLVVAALVASPSASAAAAQSQLTVSGAPGKVATSWTGTAPFNNNQDGLVYGQLGIDDPKNSCSMSNTTLNDQHTVNVTFPTGLSKSYDTLVRFNI